jgi:hypothetical protein
LKALRRAKQVGKVVVCGGYVQIDFGNRTRVRRGTPRVLFRRMASASRMNFSDSRFSSLRNSARGPDAGASTALSVGLSLAIALDCDSNHKRAPPTRAKGSDAWDSRFFVSDFVRNKEQTVGPGQFEPNAQKLRNEKIETSHRQRLPLPVTDSGLSLRPETGRLIPATSASSFRPVAARNSVFPSA